MTIHHDKLAYGKLAAQSEELSEEQIKEMLAKLNEEEGRDCDRREEEKSEKKFIKKL